MIVTTFVRIIEHHIKDGRYRDDVDIEVEGRVERDNARDPITGRGEWIVVGEPWVNVGPQRSKPLAERYHDKACARLIEAAAAYEPGEDDDEG